MPDSLRGMSRYIRDTGAGWEGADHPDGPWRPIPAPQAVSALWEQRPRRGRSLPLPRAEPTPSDRLALALCAQNTDLNPCPRACQDCRELAGAVAREIAAILRERYGGSSATADWLDGVGCHD